MRGYVSRRHQWRARRVIPLVAGAVLAAVVTLITLRIVRFVRITGLTPLVVIQLAFNTGVKLAATGERTNLLLLGIAGGMHAGADLTDTLMVLSFASHEKKFAMISVPRDLWSDTLKDKVNSAYHYGEEKKTGGGMVLAKVVVEDIIGLPIHYSLLVDFSRFRTIIDAVEGITVNVPRAFTDPQFPIAGREEDACGGDPTFACRYETVRFEAGDQLMGGEQALKYVRSRHAEGDEGSDFARSRRQQEVFLALKERLQSASVWLSLRRVAELLQLFSQTTETDMSTAELFTVAKLFTRVSKDSIQRISLEELLYAPPLSWYGRFVLLPRESLEEIHQYVRDELH